MGLGRRETRLGQMEDVEISDGEPDFLSPDLYEDGMWAGKRGF